MSDQTQTPRKLAPNKALPLSTAHLGVAAGLLILFAVLSWLMLRGVEGNVRFAPSVLPLLEAAPVLQVHIAGALSAFALGGVMFALPKGRGLHKPMGWVWVTAMAVTAISSFFLTGLNGNSYSWIHGLSAWTLIGLPMGIAAIRRKNIKAHRKHVTNMYIGGMLIAGLFTFLPGRMMWSLFFAY